jgi:hypothetical protein
VKINYFWFVHIKQFDMENDITTNYVCVIVLAKAFDNY